MKFALIATAAVFALLTSSAFAHDPIGPVNTVPLLANPTPPADKMAAHQLYVANLKAAGFNPNDTTPIGEVNTRPAMYPNHSKVPHGAHYRGNAVDRSASY